MAVALVFIAVVLFALAASDLYLGLFGPFEVAAAGVIVAAPG